MFELQILKLQWTEICLWVDEFQFATTCKFQFRASFWADANPVDAHGRLDRAIRLDRNLETIPVDSLNEGVIELQKRLATGEDDVTLFALVSPRHSDGVRELLGVAVLASADAIGSYEIRIAELTNRQRTVDFST